MTARTPAQQAVVDKVVLAFSKALGDGDLESLSDAEFDDAIATTLSALSPYDVAVFWLPPPPDAISQPNKRTRKRLPRAIAADDRAPSSVRCDAKVIEFGGDDRWPAAARSGCPIRRSS